MAELKGKIVKNSVYGLMLQIVMIPLNFLLRVILLKYVGVEFLGISGTAASMVGVLSLAEGGFGSAIAYCLYKPVVEKDYNRINQLMTVFKNIYTILGIFVILAGGILSCFIKFFFSGIEITGFVYTIFYLECLNSAISYFLCYRRTLLGANMHNYIANKVDIVCNLFFIMLGIAVVLLTRNYILYLIIMILKTCISNIIIHIKSRKIYPYLRKTKAEKNTYKEVVGYSKNLLWGNIAAFIYNSTDNIIISSFTNTINVGYLSNYTMVVNYLKTLSGAALSGVTPAIGQKQAVDRIEKKRETYVVYSQLCSFLAMLVCVPTYILLDSFIRNIYGDEYVLSRWISMLLTAIVYLYIAPYPYGTFITTSGKFEALKKVEFVGAAANLIVSIVLVQFMGIEGVLIGTVVSTLIQWFMRMYYVFFDVLGYNKKQYIIRWVKEIYYYILIVISVIIIRLVTNFFSISIYVIQFIVYGMIAVLVTVFVYMFFYRFDDKVKISYLVSVGKKIIKR